MVSADTKTDVKQEIKVDQYQFSRRKITKINTKETKPKQIKSVIPKLLKTLNMNQF